MIDAFSSLSVSSFDNPLCNSYRCILLLVFQEMQPSCLSLMTDVFGNYVIQVKPITITITITFTITITVCLVTSYQTLLVLIVQAYTITIHIELITCLSKLYKLCSSYVKHVFFRSFSNTGPMSRGVSCSKR